jgi:hypothetical protein
MRDTLAERLLVKIMEWTPPEIDSERPLLQALATFKLNDYQQFSPGIRFIESLVKWLQQFETLEERRSAYKLVTDHLIFISGEQMGHLVNILYSEKVNPILIRKTARESEKNQYLVKEIANSKEYGANLTMSLFIGLSDGSKIDQFRRIAGLNNEQVYPTYLINSRKATDMYEKLQRKIPGGKFKTVFLIDDFTASGKSYCRPDDDGKRGDGKLLVFFNELFKASASDKGELNSIIDFSNLEIHVLFYIATEDALFNIKTGIEEWQEASGNQFNFTVDCLQVIDEMPKQKIIGSQDIMSVLEKYFDASIIDEHYKKGKHEKPYLGFNECCLPLVLNHNSPNNSLPILWLPEDKKPFGLFPRISRHK